MSLSPPVPLSEGDAEQLQRACYIACLATTIAQGRLDDALDALGPPGEWHCDPHEGTLRLRGKTFAAEMLGSFDGENNFLWAWANPFLNLPGPRTTISRGARDAARRLPCAVLAQPFTAMPELDGVNEIIAVTVGNGFGAAAFVCDFPESRVPYVLLPGQLAPKWPKLYELQRALTPMMFSRQHHGVAALMRAAEYLELPVERHADTLVIHDGKDELTAQLFGENISDFSSNVRLDPAS